jgi:hypothetical protein
MARINNIVLVHGAFVDGSSWAGLYDILKEDGFDVSIVQNPTISLEGDVAATNLILDEQVGPAVLVGQASQSRGSRLHRRLRSGQRRVRQNHRRRSAVLYAAEGGISLPRQGEDGGRVRR